MNVFLCLTFIAAVFAIAYATPLFSEGDEETNQILFLAKLSSLIEARKQEMVRSAPHFASSSSLLFNTFYPRGKTDQQKVTDMLLKMREFLEMDRAKENSMFVSTKLQEATRIRNPVITGASRDRYSNHRKYATKKGEIEAAEYKATQGIDQTAEANKLLEGLLSCIGNGLPNFLQSLKETKIFGLPASSAIKIFSGLTGKSGFELYRSFINYLIKLIGVNRMSAKEQVFNFDLLRDIATNVYNHFANSSRQNGESDDVRYLLNFISALLNPTSGNATQFIDSINYFLEKFIFKQIDNMEISEEDKNQKKNALRSAVNNVVNAIIVNVNGGKQNPNNRNTLLKNVLTVLASLNSVVSNRSLLQFVDQFLAENPTNEELETKSQCLLLIFLRQSFGYLVNFFKMEREAQIHRNEVGPLVCAATFMQDAFHLLFEQIPIKVSNFGGCEDFAMAGYKK